MRSVRQRRTWDLPAPPLSEAELAVLYNDCNKRYFGSRLPKATIEWQQTPAGMMASTHPTSGIGPSIWINPLWAIGKTKAWVRQILLHEMCHLEVGTDGEIEPGHGPRWRAAMGRLQKQGERWVRADLANAIAADAEAEALTTQILKAMDKLDPSLLFDDAREVLARRFRKRLGAKFFTSAVELIFNDIRVIKHWVKLGRRFD